MYFESRRVISSLNVGPTISGEICHWVGSFMSSVRYMPFKVMVSSDALYSSIQSGYSPTSQGSSMVRSLSAMISLMSRPARIVPAPAVLD